jgi:hypothetical protein
MNLRQDPAEGPYLYGMILRLTARAALCSEDAARAAAADQAVQGSG